MVDGRGRVRIEYRVPARGLIGFQGEFMTLTRGTGLISHIFDGFAPVKGDIPERHNGVLISNEQGEAVAYALWYIQERGRLFVNPGEKLYEGMIIGIHSRENDLVVNPIKTKKLTNVRAAGKDDAILLTPPIQLTLEYAVEFIADDELVEITPGVIRIRKRFLKETDRKRASRATKCRSSPHLRAAERTSSARGERRGSEATARAIQPFRRVVRPAAHAFSSALVQPARPVRTGCGPPRRCWSRCWRSGSRGARSRARVADRSRAR